MKLTKHPVNLPRGRFTRWNLARIVKAGKVRLMFHCIDKKNGDHLFRFCNPS